MLLGRVKWVTSDGDNLLSAGGWASAAAGSGLSPLLSPVPVLPQENGGRDSSRTLTRDVLQLWLTLFTNFLLQGIPPLAKSAAGLPE